MSASLLFARTNSTHGIEPFVRRAFIVAEPFPFEGLSTRKLVIESAYYNVITAYSMEELLEAAKRFSEADAVAVHGDLPGYSTFALAQAHQMMGRQKPIIFLSTTGHQTEDHADVVLSSHDPQLLLGKLQEYFGPADTKELVRRRR